MWSHRFPIAFLISFFGVLLIILLAVFFHQVSTLHAPPQPQQREKTATVDVPSPLEFSDERVQEITTQGFRSGGLGLERTAWEVLHGKAEATDENEASYHKESYHVVYQQGLVWQLAKQWKPPGIPLAQARSRVRRYLPLDVQSIGNVSSSTDLVVDQYQSPTLARQLAPLISALADKNKKKTPNAPSHFCVAVHRLEKQYVTETLVHIGEPRTAGYPSPPLPPPQVTTTKKQAAPKTQKSVKPQAKRRKHRQ